MRDAEAIQALQANLKVVFRHPELLKQALRHRSASGETGEESNERLEFLGDAVVGCAVADVLMARLPQANEGTLAKAKAYLVSEVCLAQAALSVGVDKALELSDAEEAAGGRQRSSILADAMEAVIGAVYLDAGWRTARRVVRSLLAPRFEFLRKGGEYGDDKSRLQERVQAQYGELPQYRIISEQGRDHDKTFTAQVVIAGKVAGEGTGRSKKQAERAAAKVALQQLDTS